MDKLLEMYWSGDGDNDIINLKLFCEAINPIIRKQNEIVNWINEQDENKDKYTG